MRNLEEQSLEVRFMTLEQLHPCPHNARTHSKHQIRQIAESIRVFGFTNPVLIDAENQIVAGHGRVEAARLIGMTDVPTIRLDKLTREQMRAYVIADNKLALNAGWDTEILAIELEYLLQLDCADFDVTISGFEVAEIDSIIEGAKSEASPEEPPPDPVLDQEPVTQLGDLWQLGKHRIICGNSLHRSVYQELLGSRRAAMVFTDPPYNVKIDGHATGNGAIRHREFAMASGEMSEAEYVAFLITALEAMASFSAESSLHYVCEDWRHFGQLLTAGRHAYDELVNVCVWVKDNGGMGSVKGGVKQATGAE